MEYLTHAMPLLAGAGIGTLLGALCALLLGQNLTDGVEIATIVPSLVNCAAVGSLIAKCIAR